MSIAVLFSDGEGQSALSIKPEAAEKYDHLPLEEARGCFCGGLGV